MMKLSMTFLFSLGLMGCATLEPVYEPKTDSKPDQPSLPVGYLGFKAHREWVIQLNGCTVYDLTGAQSYQWFDRTSASVSCYTFKPSDAIEAHDAITTDHYQSACLMVEHIIEQGHTEIAVIRLKAGSSTDALRYQA